MPESPASANDSALGFATLNVFAQGLRPVAGHGGETSEDIEGRCDQGGGRGGGNIAGAILKNLNLGPIGNSIAGIVGGGIGGQLLNMVISSAGASAVAGATSSGLDLSSILSSVGGGGVGGAIVMAIVGLIKSQMSKS